MGKGQTNATNVISHLFWRAIWDRIWKLTERSQTNAIDATLGKHLSMGRHLYLGIAQIAFTPPPALKRALWGTFFQARFYHFTILFTIFSE